MQFTTTDVIGIAGLFLGTGIFGALMRVVFEAGKYHKTLHNLETNLGEVKTTLADVRDKVIILWEDRVAPGHSPRELNVKGAQILEGSGIKQVIDARYSEILQKVRDQKPENAYQAERVTVLIITSLKEDDDLRREIESGAFLVGSSVDEALYVGAIYIRDKILQALDFNVADIDKQAKRPAQ